MKKIGWLFLLAFFFGGVSTKAQSTFGKYAKLDGLRKIEIGKALSQMPETGGRAEDFVPPHWTIFNRAEGDLNTDGVKDFAFTLILDEQDSIYIDALKKLDQDDSWINDAFIIVVVDSRADRKMHLSAVNYQLLGDSGAAIRGDERSVFKLAFNKNVLDIIVSYGGMQHTNATFHFRADPPTGGFLTLIGFDVENFCDTLSENCGKWRMSENYLTNTRVETKKTYTKIRAGGFVETYKQTKIPPVKIDFMDARLNDSNKKDNVRPF